MKKILFVCLSVFMFFACSKDEFSDNGDGVHEKLTGAYWRYDEVSMDREFYDVIDKSKNGAIEFKKDNSTYFELPHIGVVVEGKFELSSNVMRVVDGEICVWQSGCCIPKGQSIYIEELTDSHLILKWYYDEDWWGGAGYYYTRFERLYE